MFGALIGDTVGSRFEFHNHKSREFALFTPACRLTDDSVMTLAIARAVLESRENHSDPGKEAVRYMQLFGRQYPNAGYGGKFARWIRSPHPEPYGSWGNGAAMRISPVGLAAASMEEVRTLSKAVTEVTHNDPEGIKGAEAVAAAVFLAKSGSTMEEIREYTEEHYYRIDFTLDEIRDSYRFDVSCQGSVPQALEAFFESDGLESAVRNAVSIGGDSDTIAGIAGAVAGAYFGVPGELAEKELTYMDDLQKSVLAAFEKAYPPVPGKGSGRSGG